MRNSGNQKQSRDRQKGFWSPKLLLGAAQDVAQAFLPCSGLER
jgi:hypothetical protein